MKQSHRKALAVLLSCLLLLTGMTAGIGALTSQIREARRGEQLDAFWEQLCALDGEITNRVIVESQKPVEPLNATGVASGYNNTTFLQFATEEDTLAALAYYEKQKNVQSVHREGVYTLCDGELDAGGYESANHHIDDTLKLITENYDVSALPEIRVAVLDTGCEDDPDFYGDRVVSTGETDETENHGTKVTGTIFFNTLPNVKIYNYDVGTAEGVGIGNAATAIEKAYRDGCTIVNMSFGGYEKQQSVQLQRKIQDYYQKGMIFVAAAGNDNKDLSKEPHYPSCYSEVKCIGALTANRSKAGFSNYGSPVNYWTTGSGVHSYFRGEDITWGGTSAATPTMVSIVANMLTLNPSLGRDVFQYIADTRGYSNEDTAKRIPDNYAAAAQMTGLSLRRTALDFAITTQNGQKYLSFSADADSRVRYARYRNGYSVQYPLSSGILYDGNPIPITENCTVTAVAYADGKHKSTPLLINLRPENSAYAMNGSMLQYQSVQEASATVPSAVNGMAVTSLADGSFAGNPFIETVVLPDSVTTIGAYAFANCPNLKKVVAPGVTTISRYAFVNCPQLAAVIAPKAQILRSCVFRHCSHLILAQSEVRNPLVQFYDNPLLLNTYRSINGVSGYQLTFRRFENGEAVYANRKDEEVTVPADALLAAWDGYFVNRTVQEESHYTTDYYRLDSIYLFDINGDSVINAKDYALLLQETS